jgi:agmatine deiminase
MPAKQQPQPHLNKQDIEQYLKDYLGVRHFIWLKRGILGDDTDGHIDDLARFVNPTTIVCAFEDNPADPDYAVLKENYDLLRKSTDQEGKPLKIIKLPMPKVKATKATGYQQATQTST